MPYNPETVCNAGKKLRIDKWLRSHLLLEDLHGLQWFGSPNAHLFAINWSHKSAHSWSTDKKKNNVFLAYSQARCGSSLCPYQQDYKLLKQNLRCALRGSRHIRYEKTLSKTRGTDACRVYRFIADSHPGVDTQIVRIAAPSLTGEACSLEELSPDAMESLFCDVPELPDLRSEPDLDTLDWQDLDLTNPPLEAASVPSSCDSIQPDTSPVFTWSSDELLDGEVKDLWDELMDMRPEKSD